MHLFVVPDTTAQYATLPPDESKHCVRVLRLGMGDEVYVASGDGTMCRAIIAVPDTSACEVEIVERMENYGVGGCNLHIAVAPTKNVSRLEWFVEKAVEMGVSRITPLVCERSERVSLKADRLRRIALSAMKQSLQAYCPVIDEPTAMSKLLGTLPDGQQRFICHCDGDDRKSLGQLYARGSDAIVLVGPEGDFSPQEVAAAKEMGFLPVTLGGHRLRTETAALYATAAIDFMNDNK